MPFTKAQLQNIMMHRGQAFVPRDKLNYAGRVCETYLRKKLYRFEDRVALDLYNRLKRVNSNIRDYALQTAGQLRLTEIGNTSDSIAFRRMVSQYATAQLTDFAGVAARVSYQYASIAYAAGWYGRLWQIDEASHRDKRVKIERLASNKVAQAILQPGLTEAVDYATYDYIGSEWQDVYLTAVNTSIVKLKRVLNNTAQQPASVLAVTQNISTVLGVNAKPKDAAKGLYNAVSLPARTAIVRSANHASAEAYKANTEMLLGCMWVTSNDNRVCPECQSHNGQIFVINSLIGILLLGLPPDGSHSGCRCFIIPLVIPVDNPNEPPADDMGEWLDEYGFYDELDFFMQDTRLESTQL